MTVGGVGTIWVNSNLTVDENYNQSHLMVATSDSAINMANMIMDKPAIKSFSAVVSCILVGGLIISLLSGSYFKSILYRGFFRGKFLDRPINVLLLCSAVIHHSTHLCATISLIVMIGFDTSLGETFGPAYCFYEYIVGAFGLGYLSVGSFGIALYRILFIKCNYWVKYRVGKGLLLGIILVMSLALTTLLVTLSLIESSSKRAVVNGCLGHSELAHSIIIEYRNSQGMLAPFFVISKWGNFQT